MFNIISLVFIVCTACDSRTGYTVSELDDCVWTYSQITQMTSLCEWNRTKCWSVSLHSVACGMRNGVDFLGTRWNCLEQFYCFRRLQIKCSNLGFNGRILRHVSCQLSCDRFNISIHKFIDKLDKCGFGGKLKESDLTSVLCLRKQSWNEVSSGPCRSLLDQFLLQCVVFLILLCSASVYAKKPRRNCSTRDGLGVRRERHKPENLALQLSCLTRLMAWSPVFTMQTNTPPITGPCDSTQCAFRASVWQHRLNGDKSQMWHFRNKLKLMSKLRFSFSHGCDGL